MDQRTMIIIGIVAIAIVVVIAALLYERKRKSERLRQQFGPEYDRAVRQHGDPRQAEAVLLEREKRVEKFSIRPLAPADRERYASEWAAVQKRFVDDPSMAVTQAEKLVTAVMVARGYPMGDFEQRAADISVNYPTVVQNYRSAREITLRHAQGKSSTEDLRQSMVYFRSLFDELLESPKTVKIGVPHERIAS
jgi:FtsZ-interacting cell division protein ZipA